MEKTPSQVIWKLSRVQGRHPKTTQVARLLHMPEYRHWRSGVAQSLLQGGLQVYVKIGDEQMTRFNMNLKGFCKDERGASLVEYSLLLGLVALAAVVFISGVGGSINTIWEATNTQMGTAATTYAGG